MNTEELLNILTYYHLQEFSSGSELIQALQEDDYARNFVAPAGGIKHSTFFDTVNDRGVEQLLTVFTELQKQATGSLPSQHSELGDLVAIDGSLIDSVLSMHWAEYRTNSKKAKLHLGFDLNHGIPRKLFLTEGNGAERPFVSRIIDPGQTGVLDRGYQAHHLFDQWQQDGCHFVCRIKEDTHKEIIEQFPVHDKSHVFFDAMVSLGTPNVNQTKKPVHLVGYDIEGKSYWVATDRFDLLAEQVALVYKLRWDIESFFAWWKRHLKVYHLFARSKNGLMVQILS
ncbi:MAG: IS4 family transposase, partial [Proteobacteria bacterium]|nr:IS4 family transposase [Pseudomonadota bacterium]